MAIDIGLPAATFVRFDVEPRRGSLYVAHSYPASAGHGEKGQTLQSCIGTPDSRNDPDTGLWSGTALQFILVL